MYTPRRSFIAPKQQAAPATRARLDSAGPWQTYQYLLSASFYAALVYAALLLLPSYYLPILAGLDPSWGFGLNYFAHSEFKFGPDLLFTYGPLGYLSVPMHVGNNITIAMCARTAVWAIMLLQVVGMWRSRKRAAASFILVGLIFSNRLYFYYWDYFLAATILLFCSRLIEEGPQRIVVILIALLTGISCLVKVSVFIMAILLFMVCLVRLFHMNWRPPQSTLWTVTLVFASGPIAYLIYNRSPSGLLLYLRGSLELASGYAAWMSLPTDWELLRRALVLIAIIIASAAYAVFRGDLRVSSAALVLVATLVAFRHGFVRSEVGHAAIFLSFVIFTFGILLSQISFTKWTALGYCGVFSVFAVLALQGIGSRWPVWSSFWWSPEMNLVEANKLRHWDRTMTNLDAVSKLSLSSTVIDRYAADVRGSSVLIFPWDLTFAAYQEFKLVPLYTLQAYSAFTNYLDRRSAAKLQSGSSPDFVLFEWQSIDGRHPLLDGPAIWNALYTRYLPYVSHGESILLKRRAQSLQLTYKSISKIDFHPGVWVALPQRPSLVGLSVDLQPTALAALARGLYKLPIVFLETRSLSGVTRAFRVPGEVLATPLPINALPMSLESLLEMWAERRFSDPVVEVRMLGDGLHYFRSAGWQFYDVQGSDIEVSNVILTGAKETLRSRFQIEKVAAISDILSG